jgi:hypothetical protein
MATLRLKMGISYNGIVHATKANPLVEVDDADALAYLLAEGHFELVGAPATGPEPEPEPDDETPEGIIGDPEPEPEPERSPTTLFPRRRSLRT